MQLAQTDKNCQHEEIQTVNKQKLSTCNWPKQTKTVNIKKSKKIVYTSRFVRVILAQGPC